MESSQFNEQVGSIIRYLRKAKGWTQEAFAALTGYSRGTIANIETGRQAASAHQLYHLAGVFGLHNMSEIYPALPRPDDDDLDDVKIHRAPDLSEAQLEQVRAVARSVG